MQSTITLINALAVCHQGLVSVSHGTCSGFSLTYKKTRNLSAYQIRHACSQLRRACLAGHGTSGIGYEKNVKMRNRTNIHTLR